MSEELSCTEKISAFYETEEHLALEFLTGGHIHLGYWEQGDEGDLAAGAAQLTQLMIDLAEIQPGQRFVDLGCGVGLPALELARQKGCLVDGVTLSSYQQVAARKRAEEAGLADTARFYLADATQLPFADATFDGGWFFESIFHMGHRKALKEAHRVLKPGGVLALTDVIDVGKFSAEEMQEAKDACNAEYMKIEDYPELLRETGYELLQLRDITAQVIAPFGQKSTQMLEKYKDEVFAILLQDQERFDGFAAAAEKFAKIGYAAVQARRA